MTGMPGKRHQRQQRLAQPGGGAAGQEAIHIVVVHEAGHQVRPRVQALAGRDAVAQVRGGPAARKHITQRAVERKVEHARQQRAAIGGRHVTLDLARLHVLPRFVDAKAFAKDMKLPPPGAARHAQHAGRLRVARVQEIGEQLRRHIKRRVHPKGIHPRFADPVPVAAPQRAPHGRVLGVQIVQARHLEVQLLLALGVVGHVGRPVVDGRRALGRIARVVAV
jgi:hypothetical protein